MTNKIVGALFAIRYVALALVLVRSGLRAPSN